MRAVAVGICAGTLALALALPALVGAQDPTTEPATAPVPEEPPAETTEPPTDEAPDEGPAAADPAAAAAVTQATSSTPVAKGAGSVSMIEYAFSPATVTISVGDTITWTNTGQEDHTATGSGFATGTVGPGGSASHTFTSAGTFPYVCDFHPNMKGTVVVNGGAPDDQAATPGTGTDPTGSLSEAEAAALPGAAGSASGLPATGESDGPLLILGLGLVGCGALAAALARVRGRERIL